jgi:murein DD-endopeptidase MepM/ murein hydrolase activator NlpD
MPRRGTVTTTVSTRPTRLSDPGEHRWPLPIRGTITTRFSAAHPGIDIAAPTGTVVRAIASGRVTWAGWKSNGGGFVVVIRHPDGMASTYNHNRAVAVSRGDVVTAGQLIAWVGVSGWATGPHLDLRIEMHGRFVDPLALY